MMTNVGKSIGGATNAIKGGVAKAGKVAGTTKNILRSIVGGVNDIREFTNKLNNRLEYIEVASNTLNKSLTNLPKAFSGFAMSPSELESAQKQIQMMQSEDGVTSQDISVWMDILEAVSSGASEYSTILGQSASAGLKDPNFGGEGFISVINKGYFPVWIKGNPTGNYSTGSYRPHVAEWDSGWSSTYYAGTKYNPEGSNIAPLVYYTPSQVTDTVKNDKLAVGIKGHPGTVSSVQNNSSRGGESDGYIAPKGLGTDSGKAFGDTEFWTWYWGQVVRNFMGDLMSLKENEVVQEYLDRAEELSTQLTAAIEQGTGPIGKMLQPVKDIVTQVSSVNTSIDSLKNTMSSKLGGLTDLSSIGNVSDISSIKGIGNAGDILQGLLRDPSKVAEDAQLLPSKFADSTHNIWSLDMSSFLQKYTRNSSFKQDVIDNSAVHPEVTIGTIHKDKAVYTIPGNKRKILFPHYPTGQGPDYGFDFYISGFGGSVPPPGKPQNFQVDRTYIDGGPVPELIWDDPPTSVDRYKIYRTHPQPTGLKETRDANLPNTWTEPDITPGKQHVYRMKSNTNLGGDSEWTANKGTYIPEELPAPSNLSLVESPQAIEVSWNHSYNVDNYQIWRRKTGKDFELHHTILDDKSGSYQYLDTENLVPDTTYYYKVRGVKSGQPTEFSDIKNITYQAGGGPATTINKSTMIEAKTETTPSPSSDPSNTVYKSDHTISDAVSDLSSSCSDMKSDMAVEEDYGSMMVIFPALNKIWLHPCIREWADGETLKLLTKIGSNNNTPRYILGDDMTPEMETLYKQDKIKQSSILSQYLSAEKRIEEIFDLTSELKETLRPGNIDKTALGQVLIPTQNVLESVNETMDMVGNNLFEFDENGNIIGLNMDNLLQDLKPVIDSVPEIKTNISELNNLLQSGKLNIANIPQTEYWKNVRRQLHQMWVRQSKVITSILKLEGTVDRRMGESIKELENLLNKLDTIENTMPEKGDVEDIRKLMINIEDTIDKASILDIDTGDDLIKYLKSMNLSVKKLPTRIELDQLLQSLNQFTDNADDYFSDSARRQESMINLMSDIRTSIRDVIGEERDSIFEKIANWLGW